MELPWVGKCLLSFGARKKKLVWNKHTSSFRMCLITVFANVWKHPCERHFKGILIRVRGMYYWSLKLVENCEFLHLVFLILCSLDAPKMEITQSQFDHCLRSLNKLFPSVNRFSKLAEVEFVLFTVNNHARYPVVSSSTSIIWRSFHQIRLLCLNRSLFIVVCPSNDCQMISIAKQSLLKVNYHQA